MFTLTVLINYSALIQSQWNKARQTIKGIQIEKEDVKLYLFANYMVIYI
jgi:hypothetical protein